MQKLTRLWAHGQAAVAALGAVLGRWPEQGSQALGPSPAAEHVDGALQLALEVLGRSGEFTGALRRACAAALLPSTVNAAAARARGAAALAPAVAAVHALLAACCAHRYSWRHRQSQLLDRLIVASWLPSLLD